MLKHLNRREMIAGTAALWSTACAMVPSVGQKLGEATYLRKDGMSLPLKPKDLLRLTFTRELLSKSLISAPDWHPYPKVEEREAWRVVPPAIAAAAIRHAEVVVGTEWASLPATLFLEYQRIGDRQHYEHVYFKRRQRLTNLVLAECVEGKGRFLGEIVNGVWLICEETFWGLPAHLFLQKTGAGSGLPKVTEPVVDLFAAETGATLSWIHYLLGTQLNQVSSLITQRIELEVKRRILDPALERNDFWWMFRTSGPHQRLGNWTPWIDSNWMVTTLLLEQDHTRRINAILKICKSLDQYMLDYLPDGGCIEGPGYWQASPASYFDCCTLLASATGGAANVLANPFIRKMEHYILDAHIAGSYYVNYGDASPQETVSGELLFRIGTGVNDEALTAFGAFNAAQELAHTSANSTGPGSDGSGRLARAVPDILSASKALIAKKTDGIACDSWYPDLCLMTARTSADSLKGFYLAVQAAPNQRGHGHNDSGSFIVFYDGDPVFIDLGPEAYSAPKYRWTAQSEFHNLPTIGGVMQSEKDAAFRASNIHYTRDDAHAGLSMNLATAYPDEAGVTSWNRSIVLDRNTDRIVLIEEFQLLRKVPIMLSFMTSRTPSLGKQGSIVLSAADKKVRDVYLNFDALFLVPTIETIQLKDEWLRGNWGEIIYRVLLRSRELTSGAKWRIEMV
jgi:hypothetical protein